MSMTLSTRNNSPLGDLGRRARGQLLMLTAEFLLGLGVNLIGLPTETSGDAKVTTLVLLVVHIGVALGLLIGAVLAVRKAARLERTLRSQAWIAAAIVVVTIAAGVLTMIFRSNWSSYLMGVGFISLFLIYGNILLRTRTV